MENPHHRRSIRLPDYDYSQNGAYFITICSYQRQRIFGEIENNEPKLSEIGSIVDEFWKQIPVHFPQTELGAFVVMPNHFHGIIHIYSLVDDPRRGTACCAPTTNAIQPIEQFGHLISGSIPTIIRSFKSAVTKRVHEMLPNYGSPIWQRNYYESVIRSEEAYAQIEGYILDNPLNWLTDKEYLPQY